MKRVITYHSTKSSGIGGVAVLVRQFHRVLSSSKNDFIEVFYKKLWDEDFIESKATYVTTNINDKKFSNFTLSKIHELICFYKFYRKQKLNNDVLVFFDPKYLIFIPKFVLKYNQIVLVQTNSFDKLYNNLWGRVYEVFIKKYVNNYIVYTDLDLDVFYKKLNLNKDSISVIPRGCRLDISSKTKLLNRKLVTICRLNEKQKNLKSMISIVENLPNGFTLDIYGDGTTKEVDYLRDLISEHDRIHYKGKVLNINETLEDYSVFLMTSNYEGFGQTLIEARSQGLPVVLYDTFEAAKWIVDNKSTGFLIDHGDEEGFRNSIVEITKNKESYLKYSSNCLVKASETDMKIIDRKWSDFFSDL